MLTPSPSAASDRALLREAAFAAGDVLARMFRDGAKAWEKRRGDPVTEADLAAEALLHECLAAARPDYGWLSEETPDDGSRLIRPRSFVVDPMDGTRAFVKGKPHFTVSLAVVEGGRPVAAAVFNPVTEEMFDAALGEGAALNGAAIEVSAARSIAGARLLGDPYRLKPFAAEGAEIVSRNSIAYRFALVAAGAFDGLVAVRGKSDWDLAAGRLLVEEAGGVASDHAGAPLSFGGGGSRQPPPLAAGPALHALLRQRLAAPEPRGDR
ncbi:MAG: 3'(2'),5'-bisphosphate nucleotidase CysQ [Maricaulaceae bacterium]|nr:3'(2'),5'-bisphosphate nucleotidase CysQ [Maricaulaceae bacterium]